MPTGVSTSIANSILALMLNGTAWPGFSATFAQLHTASPGPAGTLAVAVENVRVSCGTAPAFAAPANGQTLNNNVILWTNVVANETYAFVTLWSAVTGGTFIASGTITSQPIVIGNNFQIPVGGLAISLPVAS
jgi:hypothetical protein